MTAILTNLYQNILTIVLGVSIVTTKHRVLYLNQLRRNNTLIKYPDILLNLTYQGNYTPEMKINPILVEFHLLYLDQLYRKSNNCLDSETINSMEPSKCQDIITMSSSFTFLAITLIIFSYFSLQINFMSFLMEIYWQQRQT